MGFIVLLMGIFFFFWVVSIAAGHNHTINAKPACKVHKWVQKPIPDDNGYLVCSVCNREPNYEGRSDG